jgi:hypothetical protein
MVQNVIESKEATLSYLTIFPFYFHENQKNMSYIIVFDDAYIFLGAV